MYRTDQLKRAVLPASVFKNKSVFLCFFDGSVFFCCGKVFLVLFFSSKCVYFFQICPVKIKCISY